MSTDSPDGRKQWGLTPPISATLPTEHDIKLNEALLSELKDQNNFESIEDTEHRKKVLLTLQKVTEEFVKEVGRRKGLAPSVVNQSGGKVSTFGSYRLGVYGPGTLLGNAVASAHCGANYKIPRFRYRHPHSCTEARYP